MLQVFSSWLMDGRVSDDVQKWLGATLGQSKQHGLGSYSCLGSYNATEILFRLGHSTITHPTGCIVNSF